MGHSESVRSQTPSPIGPSEGRFPYPIVKANNPEKIRKNSIFISATHIGADLMEATGGQPIAEGQLAALNFRGYLDFSVREILEESYFSDLEDFNSEVQATYLHRVETAEFQKQQLLARIEGSVLPDELFKAVEYDGTVGRLTDEVVDDDEKIARYVKYVLARRLILDARDDISELRLLGIAIGLFLKEAGPESEAEETEPAKRTTPLTGKRISSFQSEISKATNNMVSQAEVEIAAEAEGWYDLIYPRRKEERLRETQKASKEILAPEYYYDLKLKKVLILGRLSLEEFSQDEAKKHLERLSQSGKLLIGKLALRAYDVGTARGTTHRLGALLRSGLPEGFKRDHMRTKDLERDDFIEIGRWISAIIDAPEDPRERHLNEEVFMTAKQLGIGFSIHRGSRFLNEFGSMTNYYGELGEPRTHRKIHKDFDRQKAVEAIAGLAHSLGGRRPTYEELIEAHKHDPNIPNPTTINRGLEEDRAGVAILMDEANLPPNRLKWGQEECLMWGVEHFKLTGREPREKDVAAGSLKKSCVSRRTFRGLFGSFSAYKSQLRPLLEEAMIEGAGGNEAAA